MTSRPSPALSTRGLGRMDTEDNAKAFMEALQLAICDFNQKLTEQFGENFKQLNVAVGRLLEWQDRYRVQMDEMARRLDASVEAAEQSAVALEAVAGRSASLTAAAERLDTLLQGYDRAQRDLEERLRAFAAMAAQASDAMPRVEARLDGMVTKFGQAVEAAVAEATRLAADQRARFDALREGFESMRSQAERVAAEAAKRAQETLSAVEANAKRVLDQSATQLEGVIRDTNDRLSKRLEESSRRTTERLERQVKELDEALQDELTRAIEALGGRLAAVTQHFAQDYERLAARLREIVRMAERA